MPSAVTDVPVIVKELNSGVPVACHHNICPSKRLTCSFVVVAAFHHNLTPVVCCLYVAVALQLHMQGRACEGRFAPGVQPVLLVVVRGHHLLPHHPRKLLRALLDSFHKVPQQLLVFCTVPSACAPFHKCFNNRQRSDCLLYSQSIRQDHRAF